MDKFFKGSLYGLDVKTNIIMPVPFPFRDSFGTNSKIIHYTNEKNLNIGLFETYAQNTNKYISCGYNKMEERFLISTEKIGSIVVDKGQIVYYCDQLIMRNAYLLSFGMGLAMLLRLNGYIVLHASTISINEKTILIMGGSGVGKSTFCSNLIQNYDAKLISDDMTCIKTDNAYLYTGFPVMKLWPSSVNKIFKQDASQYMTVGVKGKVYFPTEGYHKNYVNNIDAVIILQSEEEVPFIRKLGKRELLCNMYKHIYNRLFLSAQMLKCEIEAVAKVILQKGVQGYIVNCPHTICSLNLLSSGLVSIITTEFDKKILNNR